MSSANGIAQPHGDLPEHAHGGVLFSVSICESAARLTPEARARSSRDIDRALRRCRRFSATRRPSSAAPTSSPGARSSRELLAAPSRAGLLLARPEGSGTEEWSRFDGSGLRSGKVSSIITNAVTEIANTINGGSGEKLGSAPTIANVPAHGGPLVNRLVRGAWDDDLKELPTTSGALFPIPVTLSVSTDAKAPSKEGREAARVDEAGRPVAIIQVLSGTRVRELLVQREGLPAEYSRPEVAEVPTAAYRAKERE